MEWIDVNERLPPIYDYVLVCANNSGTNEPKPICIARHNMSKWEFINAAPLMPSYGAYMDIEYPMDSDDVTHWKPLPKLPKNESSAEKKKLAQEFRDADEDAERNAEIDLWDEASGDGLNETNDYSEDIK